MFSIKSIVSFILVAQYVDFILAYDENEYNDVTHDLTAEIEKISQRPEPYERTKHAPHMVTELTPPEEYYEAEYKDKPCQDKAEGKILSKKYKQREPKVIIDRLNISNANGVYKIQQEIKTNFDEGKILKKVDDVKENIPIGDNVQEGDANERHIVNQNEPDEEQMNVKDILNDAEQDHNENVVQVVNRIGNMENAQSNVKNLYNIAEKNVKDSLHVKENNNEQENIRADEHAMKEIMSNKINDLAFLGDLFNVLPKSNKAQCNENKETGANNRITDIEIKFKLEKLDAAKTNMNNHMNSLINLMLPMGGSNLNALNKKQQNQKQKPSQKFYVNYLQYEPKRNQLRYEYYFFEKYANSRLNANSKSLPDKQPSMLLNSLFSQILNPINMMRNPLLDLFNPLGRQATNNDMKNKPVVIFMNEKSAVKYKRSLDNHDKQVAAFDPKDNRVRRDADTTEMPFFNEGPLKIEDPNDLAWAKDFVKECKQEGFSRDHSWKVIHQQPPSTDVLDWYHPMFENDAVFQTIEPTEKRKPNPEEPHDPCKCRFSHKPPKE